VRRALRAAMLKPISRDAVPRALERAERYRLLNEPAQAESICQDVLAVDPGNQQALVMQLLAITDDLDARLSRGVQQAREVATQLGTEYQRLYYGGIICERYAMALLAHGAPRAGESAYKWLRDAMQLYEQAEAIRPAGEDEAILRWNTCARLIERVPDIAPAVVEEEVEPELE
jgi:hypothetical protein